MATASVIKLATTERPVYAVPELTSSSLDETNNLLQENHEKHNIFFDNTKGLHNHIVHHLLTIYALGATPAQLTQNYTNNAHYQLPLPPLHPNAPADLSKVAAFTAAEAKKECYTDFLTFFRSEIAAKGWLPVLEEYIFADDERANRMLRKLDAGLLHSLIHLGFGVEFQQPAIIAEALAEAALHADELGEYFDAIGEVEREAKGESVGLYQLYNELRGNKKVMGVTQFGVRLRFGEEIMTRAREEMIGVARRYTVKEEELEERMLEAVNVHAFLTVSAQHPPHYPRIDFFLMHCHNACIFLPSFQKHLKPAHFARLLETFVRTNLLVFAAMGFNEIPMPQLQYVLNLAPKLGHGKSWEQLFEQGNSTNDDGHVAKCLRALKNAEVMAGTQKRFEEPLKKEDVLPIAQVWMKGTVGEKNVFGQGGLWTRGAGFAKAWDGFPSVEEEFSNKGHDM